MRRVRAYSRDERKRLIIHVFADAIRKGLPPVMTAAELAREMDIRPSTKLRQILAEMAASQILRVTKQDDGGIAGFRFLYELNPVGDAFAVQHTNRHAASMERTIRLNTKNGTEALLFS